MEQTKSFSRVAKGKQIHVDMKDLERIQKKVEIKDNMAVVPEDKQSEETD